MSAFPTATSLGRLCAWTVALAIVMSSCLCSCSWFLRSALDVDDLLFCSLSVFFYFAASQAHRYVLRGGWWGEVQVDPEGGALGVVGGGQISAGDDHPVQPFSQISRTATVPKVSTWPWRAPQKRWPTLPGRRRPDFPPTYVGYSPARARCTRVCQRRRCDQPTLLGKASVQQSGTSA